MIKIFRLKNQLLGKNLMKNDEIISWLLEGDISIQYQTYRDLLVIDKPELRKRIETEGWGHEFLSYRKPDGHWGQGFYQTKWISTHYTVLDLRNLNISSDNKVIRETVNIILQTEKGDDGGINPSRSLKYSDVCISGMVLNYACYFGAYEDYLKSIIDYLLFEKMNDGGFNCQTSRKGAVHSSLHTTLSVVEGFIEYEKNGYKYRLDDLIEARKNAEEFILMHKLFKSDKTGEIINPNFLKLRYPGRWYYDILKAMDYFQYAKVPFDSRMDDAINIIHEKRTKEGLWKLASKYSGKIHFEMEIAGKPSRWNTLRAMRVLKYYEIEI